MEDKLTPAQRLRLEALIQAISISATMGHRASIEQLFVQAQEIEGWLRKANSPPSPSPPNVAIIRKCL
jgi:hypothetical protein